MSGGAQPLADDIVGPAPWHLIAPFAVGAELALDWKIEALSGVRRGAAVLTLCRGAERARVHLCLRGDRPRGIASSAHLDFVLMNGANGHTPTEESLGRVLKTMALKVREHEAQTRRAEIRDSRLLSHSDRLVHFGAGTLA